LSGFVLALPSVKEKPQSYPVFITRRIFRIYVPYLAAIALAVLGNLCWHGALGLTPFADRTWGQPVHLRPVLQHILFLGQFDYVRFNTAIWTLVIEMRVSIVFPVLCLIVLRIRTWISLLVVAIVSILLGFFQIRFGINEFETNCYFTLYFVVGILLARYKDKLAQWASDLPKPAASMYLAGAVLFYFYGSWALQLASRVLFKLRNPRILAFDGMVGLGATLIIVLSLGFLPFSRFLLSAIPQFLGKVSYSMYLIHSTVLFALLHMLNGKTAPAVILLIYVSLVLVGSVVMYRFVEKPAMDFGRRITTRAPRLSLQKAT
jgi:peptidoglycan/LPS O-acetylase OafA/YrhL